MPNRCVSSIWYLVLSFKNTCLASKHTKYKIHNTKYSKAAGFSLIEILISFFFIGALVTILLSASGTLFTTRKGRLQTKASKIATKHIELLRNTAFTNLTVANDASPLGAPYGTCNPCFDFADTELTDLPNGATQRIVSDYGNTKIKYVTVVVRWNDPDEQPTCPQNCITMDTLIYENGL